MTIYRCNRGFVSSRGAGENGDPREMEVRCSIGSEGGFVAPANGSCVPGNCSTIDLQGLSYANWSTLDKSIPIDASLTVNCIDGYTIDGVASGPRGREVRCDQDTKLVPLYSPKEDNDCKPVRCGELQVPENAHIKSSHIPSQKIYFNDEVQFECDEGFIFKAPSILAPPPINPVGFSLRCDASGMMIPVDDPSSIIPGKCVPANCPMPPTFNNSDVVAKVTDRISVGQQVQYVCDSGLNFVNSTNSSSYSVFRSLFPLKSQFRVACVWDKAEKTAVFDTDPVVARCANVTEKSA